MPVVAPPDEVYVPNPRYREAFFLDIVYSWHAERKGDGDMERGGSRKMEAAGGTGGLSRGS